MSARPLLLKLHNFQSSATTGDLVSPDEPAGSTSDSNSCMGVHGAPEEVYSLELRLALLCGSGDLDIDRWMQSWLSIVTKNKTKNKKPTLRV